MIKNIEWLKEEIGELPCVDTVFNSDGSSYIDSAVPVLPVYDLINQLDEAEVLSQEWIKYNQLVWRGVNGAEHYVPSRNLYGKLVPKQELPVVPNFVAEWIEKYRERETNVWHLMNNVSIQKDCSLELWSWLWGENNVDVLARAWLDGFTAEEEQKFYVLLPEIVDNWRYVSLAPNHWGVTVRYTDTLDDVHEFTEQEIKDYDPRYMTFAKPVEELEE